MPRIIHDTSGQADPYWYEWFVGLIEVLKLLNPDDDVETVAFQVSSIKVWDDVVVQLKNGRRCYQVKHSRVEKNLTFGSLVEHDESSKSLLSALYSGWLNSGLNDPATQLILITNRQDGSNWSTLENGKRRPPLLKFWSWLQSELREVQSVSEINSPQDFEDAWLEWCSSLDTSDLNSSTAFLRQLVIRVKEDELDGLESRIRRGLSGAFGISDEKAAPLFDALCRELRKWTTGHPGVTVETLCSALTIPADRKELAQAPPPPNPFFPTRIPVVGDLETDLLADSERPIVFLTGDAGSGKTSAISWLANRRVANAFQGIIGIRFFCFEPIRPEQPIIAPDASRVKPQELWFSFLSQLRVGLTGRLRELNVPLLNSLLDWKEARAHVLRLADVLGQQLGRRFVVAIDGIDHAARASQVLPEQIKDFFSSLPTPEELENKNIRLLIGGQPPEFYADQYPSWLQGPHNLVRRIDLPRLERKDIRALLENSAIKNAASQIDEYVRLIDELSKGNTLAVVFAVAESEQTQSLSELRAILEQRRLSTGLTNYYDSIWTHALRNSDDGLSCTLAGMISIARKPIKPDELAGAFTDWNKPIAAWRELLADLGPLLFATESGFVIRHNDVRVFLANKFQICGEVRRREFASQLATYYLKNESDRVSAHHLLFTLLNMANRDAEKANIYSVDWVMEGAILDFEFSQLRDEGQQAAERLSKAGIWKNVVSVGCALQTLNRLTAEADIYPTDDLKTPDLPPFLPSEANVWPLSQWSLQDFRQLIRDCRQLLNGGDANRAKGLVNRWFSGLTFNEIVNAIPDIENKLNSFRNENEPQLDHEVRHEFEWFGRLCGDLELTFGVAENPTPNSLVWEAFYEFEKGLVRAITIGKSDTWPEKIFPHHWPLFNDNIELAVRNAAKEMKWIIVNEILANLNTTDLSKPFLAESTWYALRAGLASENSDWLKPLDENGYGLNPVTASNHYFEIKELEPHLCVCRSLGWTRIGFDAAEIADSILKIAVTSQDFKHSSAFQLLFECSAVIGRLIGLVSDQVEQASAVVSPNKIRQLLTALWSRSWVSGYIEASKIAAELVELCKSLSAEHKTAVFEAALPFAENYVLGPRMQAIWKTVLRHGRLDVLRKWTDYHIGNEGQAWKDSNNSIRETIKELAPLAESIGQHELVKYASDRVSWLRISYQEKDYSFGEVSRWFMEGAKNDPLIWSNYGWRLWQLCVICDDKDGDNRHEGDIFSSISAAAICCGAADWLRLISTTFERNNSKNWQERTRETFIEGAVIALQTDACINESDLCPLWCIALSLSYWIDNGDNGALRRLRECLLNKVSHDQRTKFELKLEPVSPTFANREDDDGDYPDTSNSGNSVPSLPCGPRTDLEFWNKLDANLAGRFNSGRQWGFDEDLYEVARERAILHGNEAILEGLEIHLGMHARWTFGGGPPSLFDWNTLPYVDDKVTWEIVAIELLKLLLTSRSSEALGAALEGMHKLVDNNPNIIRSLFDAINDEWSHRLLLNSAESWAVSYPKETATVRAKLLESMEHGILETQLQAWVVLSLNCIALNEERIEFPIPSQPEAGSKELANYNPSLLEIPSTKRGSVRSSNKYSSAHSMLLYCKYYGFDFSPLKGLIGYLLSSEGESDELKGPHRRTDFMCMPLDTENAVGYAISQILCSQWFTQEHIALLCQAFLTNEDPWIYRARPRSVTSAEEWPQESEYEASEITPQARKIRMLKALTSAGVLDGWKVFSGKVFEYTSKHDYVLHYWYENRSDSLVLNATKYPACLGSRSFIWSIGEPRDPPREIFVSGLFVGGHQRLNYSHFEIRPPIAWRELLGWIPSPKDPFTWLSDGVPVAKYERIHGVLRRYIHEAGCRQPFLHRWVVTDEGFTQANSVFDELVPKSDFEQYLFGL